MVVAGNVNYRQASDLPDVVPVFPLDGALLLPGGQMPLNIFEPRYIEMVDAAMRAERIIGMIQPALDGRIEASGEPALCAVGCLGRVIGLNESGDGRYIVTLQGVVRFRVVEETASAASYRTCRIAPFAGDFDETTDDPIDREALLRVFRLYLSARDYDIDFGSLTGLSDVQLVNVLGMLAVSGSLFQQGLLEAIDLGSRYSTLLAVLEVMASRFGSSGGGLRLQ